MTHEEMLNWLKTCEGYNSHPYLDTVGKVTIGWGRCLDTVGISQDEAQLMLENDLRQAEKDLSGLFWFHYQPQHVKDALTNMVFNLGLTHFLTFKKMIHALIAKDYTTAAVEALDSKWAKQVGKRARDIALMIRQA